jgi:hypothetical protein
MERFDQSMKETPIQYSLKNETEGINCGFNRVDE